MLRMSETRKGTVDRFLGIFCVLYFLYHALFLAGVFGRFGIIILIGQHIGISLTGILILTFLLYPCKKGGPVRRWYDILLLVGGVAACLYVVVFQNTRIMSVTITGVPFLEQVILFYILALAVMEGIRRVIGLAYTLVVLFFLIYPMFAEHFPSFLFSKSLSVNEATLIMYVGGYEGLFGPVMQIASVTVILFIYFSYFLQVTGGANVLIDFANSLAGGVRGGPAKIAVIASGFFGMLSGSTAANVASTGAVTIPMMKRAGYSANFAGAVESVASNGGQFMPPVMGTVAFVVASWLNISYWAVCTGAFLPACIYFVSLYFQVDFEAAKKGLKGLPEEERIPFKKVAAKGLHFVVPVIALMLFLGVFGWGPERAVLYTMLILFAVAALHKTSRQSLTWSNLMDSVVDGTKGFALVGIAMAGAGILMGGMCSTGLGISISQGILFLAHGNKVLLLLVSAVACYIMGMGLSSLPIYVILATLIAPAVIKAGVLPLAAHLFIFYWGLVSFITPPVAMAPYVACGISGGDPFRTGWLAARLGIVIYLLPFIWVFNPVLLLKGSPWEVALATATSLVASYFLAAAASGYLLRPTNWLQRVMLAGGAVLMIWPGWVTDMVGLAACAIVFLRQYRQRKIEPLR